MSRASNITPGSAPACCSSTPAGVPLGESRATSSPTAGVAALEMTKSYTPDVAFLDIGMPGTDGYEVDRRLRQQPGLESVVLAALTGWGQKEDRRRTAEAGFDHHLVKPPEPRVVEGLLSGLKTGRREAPEGR